MSTEIKMVEIKDVQFEIAALTDAQRKDFEVIDGENLSFIALDEIYSLQELIGI